MSADAVGMGETTEKTVPSGASRFPRIIMSIATTDTATHLVKADTRRETKIGYQNWPEADTYFRADYLYLRKGAYWEYQDEVDAGKRNGPKWYNGSYYTYVENRNLIEHYAARLELTHVQRERTDSFFLVQDLGKRGIDKRFVAWAICTYVVHSDKGDIRQTHPACKEETSEKAFRELADGLGLADRQRHQLYGKVQNWFARDRWGEGYINRSVLSMAEQKDEDEPVVGTLTPPGYDTSKAPDGFEDGEGLGVRIPNQDTT